jgi:hypothetical protein
VVEAITCSDILTRRCVRSVSLAVTELQRFRSKADS